MNGIGQLSEAGTKPKVLVFGSCVTRDIFNVSGAENYELVEYFARSSLSVFASASIANFSLDGIESPFQRRMVERDLDKSFIAFLENSSFDILLLDLIDERFALCELTEGCFVTVSNEFLKAKIPSVVNGEARRVVSGSVEFKDLWCKGVKVVFTTLKRLGLLNKVYINCAQWADRLEGETIDPPFSTNQVQHANELLRWMYQHLTQYLPKRQFLYFDPSLFVSSKEHIWGVSPFHFTDRYYEVALGKISSIISRSTSKQTLAEVWNLFNRNLTDLIADTGGFDQINDCEIDTVLAGKVDEIYSGDDVWKERFNKNEIGCIESLLFRMATSEFRDELVLQSFNKGALEIPSLFGGEKARCSQSIYVHNRNFLRFLDNGATFYLIQHHKFARAIYFPLASIVIVIDVIALPISAVYALNRVLAKNLEAYIRNSSRIKEARFSGVLASYPRPYHFFYDTLPIIFYVHNNLIPLSSWPLVIQFESGAFISIAEFFGSPDKQLMLSDGDALNVRLSSRNEFCIQLGYATKRDLDVDELDAKLIKFGIRVTENDLCYSEQFALAKDCNPLIWFGIGSEKRSWKEQVEGIAKIINSLSITHPNLGVIFDGITSTIVQDRRSTREKLAVDEVDTLRCIRGLLDRQVPVFDLIGSQSTTKIAFGSIVTSFLTNFLTDSMYVARIARKPGLAHGAARAMYSDHLHPNTYFVPKEWVRDETTHQSNWSAVSYSISSVLVAKLFEVVTCNREWALTDFCLFSPRSQVIIRKLPEAQEVIRLSDDRAEYLSVNGCDLRFDNPGKDSTPVQGGETFDFYFRGKADGEVKASLVVIAHNNSGRSLTATIPLGGSSCIRFPLDVLSYRLFIRLQGRGRLLIKKIEAIPCKIDNIVTDNDNFELDVPSNIEERLSVWNQPVFEHESPQDFLAIGQNHPSG